MISKIKNNYYLRIEIFPDKSIRLPNNWREPVPAINYYIGADPKRKKPIALAELNDDISCAISLIRENGKPKIAIYKIGRKDNMEISPPGEDYFPFPEKSELKKEPWIADDSTHIRLAQRKYTIKINIVKEEEEIYPTIPVIKKDAEDFSKDLPGKKTPLKPGPESTQVEKKQKRAEEKAKGKDPWLENSWRSLRATHSGTREEHQDFFWSEQFPADYDISTVIAIADGIGSADFGAFAAQNVIDYVARSIFQNAKNGIGDYPKKREAFFISLFEGVNQNLNDRLDYEKINGACTCTLTIAMVDKRGTCTVAWVGDSPFLRVRREKDDIETLFGKWEPHSQKSNDALIRFLGEKMTKALHNPGYFEFETQPEDVILVCSDGLTGRLHLKHIEQIIVGAPNGPEASRMLIKATLKKMRDFKKSQDNVSFAMIYPTKWPQPVKTEYVPTAPPKGPRVVESQTVLEKAAIMLTGKIPEKYTADVEQSKAGGSAAENKQATKTKPAQGYKPSKKSKLTYIIIGLALLVGASGGSWLGMAVGRYLGNDELNKAVEEKNNCQKELKDLSNVPSDTVAVPFIPPTPSLQGDDDDTTGETGEEAVVDKKTKKDDKKKDDKKKANDKDKNKGDPKDKNGTVKKGTKSGGAASKPTDATPPDDSTKPGKDKDKADTGPEV